MDTEKTRELREYIHLLLHLESIGIDCKIKIKQVLVELHSAMGFVNIDKVDSEYHITGGVISGKVITGSKIDTELVKEAIEKINAIPLTPLHAENLNPFNIFG